MHAPKALKQLLTIDVLTLNRIGHAFGLVDFEPSNVSKSQENLLDGCDLLLYRIDKNCSVIGIETRSQLRRRDGERRENSSLGSLREE